MIRGKHYWVHNDRRRSSGWKLWLWRKWATVPNFLSYYMAISEGEPMFAKYPAPADCESHACAEWMVVAPLGLRKRLSIRVSRPW